MPQNDDSPDVGPDGEETRRNFAFEIAALICGGIVSLGPLAIGLFAFLDPLGKRKAIPTAHKSSGSEAPEGFVRVAALDALAVGAPPRRLKVIADKRDAWNYVVAQPIGAVFAERVSESEVRIFNVTCPHAGCSVACNGIAFHCPCHNSSFNLDGTKMVSETGRENPSPRPLDQLDVDPTLLAKGEVWVEFKNFYTGIEEKIPKT